MSRSLPSFRRAVIRLLIVPALLVTALAGLFFTHRVAAAPTFTAGNLAILVAGASASNTTGSVVEINTTTAGQSPIQTISISGTGTDAYRMSGSATSTGYVSSSNDRTLLTFMGANSTDTSSNVNTLNPRGVFTVNSAGVVVKQTTYTGASGNQTSSGTSLNNSTWYIGDQGGFYSNGTIAASPAGNIRGVKSFGGTVYAFTASASLKSETLQNYLNTMGRFHRYSFGNIMLISAQKPTATRVAGFHTWKDLDRQVKKTNVR